MSLKPGQHLGQYEILEQIGKGGMATVYLALQPSLSRQVAIKVIPEFFAEDPAFHERFRQEAMAVASLRHANILNVFDWAETDGVAYMVSEYVDGGSLADLLGKPMPVEECIRITKAIGSALDYAHSRGVIHRDVKPGNILLMRDGTPVLSDFGLALMIGGSEHDAKTRLTMVGATLGTPAYMAPEQAGNSDVGASADLYALATIVYEMLTGSVPYSGDTPLASLLARLSKPLPPPRERNPNISEAIQDVVFKGLAREPGERYSTAGAMVEALEAAAEGKPAATPALAQKAVPSVAAPAKSGKGKVLIAVLGLIAAIVLIAVFLKPGRNIPSTPPGGESIASATAPANKAPAAAESEPAASPVPANTVTPPVVPPVTPVANVSPSTASNDQLPPHGKLLFSAGKRAAEIATLQQQNGGNKIEATNDGAILVNVADTIGASANIPVNGVENFVAVIRYVPVSQKSVFRFRFRFTQAQNGQVVVLPTYLKLDPPTSGALVEGDHACCSDFDMYVVPKLKESIFTGPRPASAAAIPNEEQVIAIAANGPQIVVYSHGREIARATNNNYVPGRIQVQVGAVRGSQTPAVLRINALDIYEAPEAASGPRPGIAAVAAGRGRLIYALADNVAEVAAQAQQSATNTIAVKGKALEFSAGEIGGVVANLRPPRITDFVAVLRYTLISRRPELQFRFHQNGANGQVIVIPAYQQLAPPSPGAMNVGTHTCCLDFDAFIAPRAPNSNAIFTGPQVVTAPAIENVEQEAVIWVKGPVIVVFANGREVARMNDSTFPRGGVSLRVSPRTRADFPSVLRVNALEIYEARQ